MSDDWYKKAQEKRRQNEIKALMLRALLTLLFRTSVFVLVLLAIWRPI